VTEKHQIPILLVEFYFRFMMADSNSAASVSYNDELILGLTGGFVHIFDQFWLMFLKFQGHSRSSLLTEIDGPWEFAISVSS